MMLFLALAVNLLLLVCSSSLHKGLHSHRRLLCSSISANDAPTSGSSSSSSTNNIPTITADDIYTFRTIGVVKDSYDHKFDTPKQATISRHEGGLRNATIHIFPEFIDCLDKLDDFDFIWVISVMNRNNGYRKKIVPQPRVPSGVGKTSNVPKEVGLFASRSPHRPNSIALSAISIIRVDVELGLVHVNGLDLLNGTPVLDIKPYIPAFDSFPNARAGWMDTITTAEDARINGYQSITNARGRRRARKRGRLSEVTL